MKTAISEEIIWLRKTIPLEDWTPEMFENNSCSMQMSYGIEKSQVKEFLKKHPELIARNKDKDLTPYL